MRNRRFHLILAAAFLVYYLIRVYDVLD